MRFWTQFGAILKEGATIRGLTTAASLWAVAAVGMAAGAGAWGVAGVLTTIAIVSLWPLRIITYRLVGRNQHRLFLKLTTADPHRLGAVVETISERSGAIVHMSSSHAPGTGLVAEVEVRLVDVTAGAQLPAALADLAGIELIEARSAGD